MPRVESEGSFEFLITHITIILVRSLLALKHFNTMGSVGSFGFFGIPPHGHGSHTHMWGNPELVVRLPDDSFSTMDRFLSESAQFAYCMALYIDSSIA